MASQIKDLYAGAINVESRFKDWSIGYGEGWEHYQPSECYECGKLLASWEGQHKCPKCGTRLDPAEGPMMNFFYPLPGFDPDEVGGIKVAAFKVFKVGSVCLVHLEDDDEEDGWGLALTGGGMNLSWDICAAYVAVGYLPPLHFCDGLPNFAGMTLSPKVRRVLAAGRRACRIGHRFIKNTERRLRNLTETLKANTAARKKAA